MMMTKTRRRSVVHCLLSICTAATLVMGTAAGPQARATAPVADALVGKSPGAAYTLLPDGRWLVTGGGRQGSVSDAVQVIDSDFANASAADVQMHLSTAREGHTATVLPNGEVFVFGGVGVDGNLILQAELISVSAGTSTPITTPGLLPRARHTATLLTDGRVLIAGGVDSNGTTISQAQLWDPQNRSVGQGNIVLQTPRYNHSAELLATGDGLLVGGKTDVSDTLPAPESFDPRTNLFQATTQFGGSPLTAMTTPAIADSIPVAEATDVAVDARIAVRFSEPLSIDQLNAANVTLVGSTGSVEGKVVGAESGRLMFFTPASELSPGATYTLFMRGVSDASGATLPLSTIRFTTRRLSAPVSLVSSTSVSSVKIEIVTPTKTAVNSSTESTASHATATTSAALHKASSSTATRQESPVNSSPVIEDWVPSEPNRHGTWRVLGLPGDPSLAIAGLSISDLVPPSGQTSIVGHVLRINGEPLPGVSVSVGKVNVVTDTSGRFLLPNVPVGAQQLLVDGTGVSSNGRHYTKHYIQVTVNAGDATQLPAPVYLARVDPASEVTISSPAAQEIVLTHPDIPGLEVHIPKGTVLREYNGKIVTKVSITPLPIDRAPYPTPASFSAYFTLQPGGAYVDGAASQAIHVVYPNYLGLAPGSQVDFYNYDPSASGWTVYGHGKVTANGKQVAPDERTGFRQIMGFGLGIGNAPPPKGPVHAGKCAGDPVDCATGFFTNTETDMVVADTVPISVTRTYQSNDPNVHAFGVGTNLSYAMWLYQPAGNSDVYLVLADGSQIHYTAQSGTSVPTWMNVDSPSAFYGSVMRYVQGSNGQINLTNDLLTITMVDHTILNFASDGSLNQLLSVVDSNNNEVQIIRAGGRSGNITEVISPNGRTIQFLYDSCNRITQAQDNLGRTVIYTYNTPLSTCTEGLYQVKDQNSHVESYAYDSSNRLQSMQDKNNNRVFYNNYNSSNQVSNQTLADGAYWQFSYGTSGSGTTTTITDPRNYVEVDTFNSSGYVTNSILAQGKTEQQTYVYNRLANNLLNSVTDQLGRLTTYNNYDAYGHPSGITYLSGTSSAVTYGFTYDPIFQKPASYTDPLSHQTQLAYDSFGNLHTGTNALGNTWTVISNSQGLPSSIVDPLNHAIQIGYVGGDISTVTDALGRVSTYFTDEVGRVVTSTDPAGETYQYGYDARDQLTSITDPNGGVTQITYDPNGNVSTVKDPRNLVAHQYFYDSRNRLHIYTDPDGKSDTYGWDYMGNLSTKLDRKSQLTQYSYDGINRPTLVTYQDNSTITITWDGGNRATKFVDSLNGTISRVPDGLDRLTQETSPQGQVTYQYDNGNRRQSMTVTGQPQVSYGFDNANRLTNITQGSNAVVLGYDAANRRTGVTLPNGIIGTFGFDNANELTSISYNLGSTNIANASYSSYDPAGRLLAASGTLVRPILDASISGATSDAANHLTAFNASVPSYDANGSLTTLSGAAANTYTWNVRNQLVSTGKGTLLSYDAVGRLVSKTESGTATPYLYDGANQITAGNNFLLRGLGLDDLFADVQGSTTIGYLVDGLGSVSMLTNSAGATTTLYSYGAYGATSTSGTSGAASTDTPFKYAGGIFDQADQLYYDRARYYSPQLQRFISEDPIGLDGGINPYAYVGGNPISFSDPSGLVRWGDVATNSLGVIGSGVGVVLGGALVSAPTGVSQIVGGAVLAKSIYAWGTSWYGLTRAFSDDSSLDITSRYQTLPRAVASGFSCSASAQKLADAGELALDLTAGRVTAGFARNPSGFLQNPAGYPLLNSNQFTHAASFGELSSQDLNALSDLMQATQTVQYGVGAFQ